MSIEMVANHVLFISPQQFEDTEYMPLADIAGKLSKGDLAIIEKHVTTALEYIQAKGIRCAAITEKCIYVKQVRAYSLLFIVI